MPPDVGELHVLVTMITVQHQHRALANPDRQQQHLGTGTAIQISCERAVEAARREPSQREAVARDGPRERARQIERDAQ